MIFKIHYFLLEFYKKKEELFEGLFTGTSQQKSFHEQTNPHELHMRKEKTSTPG